MKSRDGFEEVNRELREGAWVDDPVSRRADAPDPGRGRGGARRALGGPARASPRRRRSSGAARSRSAASRTSTRSTRTTRPSSPPARIHNNIYNGLLKITSTDGKSVDFKPELAREWEIQGDRTHVFRLHKGVTFHNGDPCTVRRHQVEPRAGQGQAAGAHPRLEARAARVHRDARPAHHQALVRQAVSLPPRGLHRLHRAGRHHPVAARGQGEGQGLRAEPGRHRALQVRGVEGGRLHLPRALRELLGEGRRRRRAPLPRQGAHQVHHRALHPGGRAQDRRGGRDQLRGASVRGRSSQGSQAQRVVRRWAATGAACT